MAFRDWFLKDVPHVVDDQDMSAPWSGRRDGAHFRCAICGRFFEVGDVIRHLYSNYSGSPFTGNPFVCDEPCAAPGKQAVLQELARRVEACWFLLERPPGRPRPALPAEPGAEGKEDDRG